MAEQIRKIKVYGFFDFLKVLKTSWLILLLAGLITSGVIGGALELFSLIVRHDEYTATIVKVSSDYDVPVVRSTFRNRFRTILSEMYADRNLSDTQLNRLSRDLDEHLEVTEDPAGTFTFCLSSFNADETNVSDEDFISILNALVDWFNDTYAEKIVASYLFRSSPESDAISSFNYYIQAEWLESFLDSAIDEIQTVAGMKHLPGIDIDISETAVSGTSGSTSVIERSEFAAFYCEENGMRISDVLLALETLYSEVTAAKAYISANGIENPDSTSMREYIEGKLLQEPGSDVWTNLLSKFSDDSAYATADEDGQAAFESAAENRIEAILSSIRGILDDYNIIANSYAQSVIPEHVIISATIVEEDVSAIDIITVIIAALAALVIAIIIAYFARFTKMRNEGEIGTEFVEETDEP